MPSATPTQTESTERRAYARLPKLDMPIRGAVDLVLNEAKGDLALADIVTQCAELCGPKGEWLEASPKNTATRFVTGVRAELFRGVRTGEFVRSARARYRVDNESDAQRDRLREAHDQLEQAIGLAVLARDEIADLLDEQDAA